MNKNGSLLPLIYVAILSSTSNLPFMSLSDLSRENTTNYSKVHMASVLVKHFTLDSTVKVNQYRWKLMCESSDNIQDRVFIKNTEGTVFRYRLIDVVGGHTNELADPSAGVLVKPSKVNIQSSAYLRNDDIVCLTKIGNLIVLDPSGNIVHTMDRKGRAIATCTYTDMTDGKDREYILLLEDRHTIHFLDSVKPVTFSKKGTIRVKERLSSILLVSTRPSHGLILASRFHDTPVIIKYENEPSKNMEFVTIPIPADNILIKKCLRGD